jgi:hypothetical protein
LAVAGLGIQDLPIGQRNCCSINDDIYRSLLAVYSSLHIHLRRSASQSISGERTQQGLAAADASIFATGTSTMASRKLVTNLAQSGCRTSKDLFSRAVPCYAAHNAGQKLSMATVAPPVTQTTIGSKGPTAMVFMNMGGPSTTDQVGDFLSRLFVSKTAQCSPHMLTFVLPRQMAILFPWVDCNHTSDP